MSARAKARCAVHDAQDLHALIQRNAYFFPRRLAFEAVAEGCPDPAKCYEVKADGSSGRWLAFHIGSMVDCNHEHHKDEVWLA